MYAVAVFGPSQPAAYLLSVIRYPETRYPIQPGGHTAEVSLDAFPDKRLVMPEHEADKIQSPAVPVGTVVSYRKDLFIPLQPQLQILHVFPYLRKKPVQFLLTRSKKHHVVSIAKVIPYLLHLLYPMIEVGQIQVGEILGEIVADRHSFGTVDDLVQEPERIPALNLLPDDGLEYVMVNGRVELAHVYLQAVPGPFPVLHRLSDLAHGTVYSPLLDTAVRICGEYRYPYRFEDIHDGMMDDPVGIVRQLEDLPFFRVMYGEGPVFRVMKRTGTQHLMQDEDIPFPIAVMHTHAIGTCLPASGLLVRQIQVVQ